MDRFKLTATLRGFWFGKGASRLVGVVWSEPWALNQADSAQPFILDRVYQERYF